MKLTRDNILAVSAFVCLMSLGMTIRFCFITHDAPEWFRVAIGCVYGLSSGITSGILVFIPPKLSGAAECSAPRSGTTARVDETPADYSHVDMPVVATRLVRYVDGGPLPPRKFDCNAFVEGHAMMEAERDAIRLGGCG